jgi:predicted GNAT superfamily acetyltransferase
MEVREIVEGDWPQILELNEGSVSQLSELDRSRLEWIVSLSDRSVAIDDEGGIVAFAIALTADTGYDSRNYRWFDSHFDRFYYLDRVVVAEPFRRRGLATRLYDLMEAEAAARFGRMVCDVGYEPPNEASLAFHAASGYSQLTRLHYGGEKAVALLCREFEPVGAAA